MEMCVHEGETARGGGRELLSVGVLLTKQFMRYFFWAWKGIAVKGYAIQILLSEYRNPADGEQEGG